MGAILTHLNLKHITNKYKVFKHIASNIPTQNGELGGWGGGGSEVLGDEGRKLLMTGHEYRLSREENKHE